jgi:threonine/homoserine/homoserine lactone efflux protein
MQLETWLLFVITEGVLSATPGPAVLFVLSQALRGGAAKSVWASAGILSANAVYFLLSATSLGAILIASYNLFFLVKWVGAAYLVYLGFQTFLSRHAARRLPEPSASAFSQSRIWRDGVLLQLANPKALLFFVAILPQFIDPAGSLAFQVLILGVSSIMVEFCILLAYGLLAGKASSAARSARFEKLTQRVGGALLIGAGLGLAGLKRT